jgi:hypothetical protein
VVTSTRIALFCPALSLEYRSLRTGLAGFKLNHRIFARNEFSPRRVQRTLTRPQPPRAHPGLPRGSFLAALTMIFGLSGP